MPRPSDHSHFEVGVVHKARKHSPSEATTVDAGVIQPICIANIK
jgi:hypothetical protein